MQDEGQQAGDGGDVWNDGWRDEDEDRTENAWTTSRSAEEKKSPHSTGRCRIAARVERWRRRHLTPTGTEPTEQWIDPASS